MVLLRTSLRAPIVARGIAIALILALSGAQAEAQNLKSWRHGVIEPKGDAGFMVMVGQRLTAI
jgi:hypothetical protein